MATRTGINKGSSALRGSRHEYLRYVLSPKGSAANFSLDDDKNTTVVADNDFPQGGQCIWRLQSAPDQAATRLTAMDNTGSLISGYDRVVKQTFIPSYTVGLVFGTAIGYDLNVDHCSATGEVIEHIANVKYTNGAAGEYATELIQLDLEDT
jgi:hypothetical protein